MNYRHNYHAGNFSDVVKHLILTVLIKALQKKPKPFCYIDTHAGSGLYHLRHAQAQKTEEATKGIRQLLRGEVEQYPSAVQDYLALVQRYNVGSSPQSSNYYPGSPLLALSLLHPEDSAILNELHPEDVHSLRQTLRLCEQAHIHERDAYEFLPAVLPPKEHRGLILIDPPFEKPTEFKDIIVALNKALLRFASGVYLVWFPIKQASLQDFYQQLSALPAKDILLIEFAVGDYKRGLTTSLQACGLAIINPPWRVFEELEILLPSLNDKLALDSKAECRLRWLTPLC